MEDLKLSQQLSTDKVPHPHKSEDQELLPLNIHKYKYKYERVSDGQFTAAALLLQLAFEDALGQGKWNDR